MSLSFVFPGQGSQSIGMGRDLYDNFAAARHVVEEVEEALNFKLSKLMFEGPADELTLTENTQPALLTASMMVVRVLEGEMGHPLFIRNHPMAGHSLGEYSALCAAGAIALKDAVRMVRLRGKAMQAAVPVGTGAMAAILGLSIEAITECLEGLDQPTMTCGIANDNCPGQVVISGHADAVATANERCLAAGAKRAMLLPVSAPFHSPLMKPAADVMQDALAGITIEMPKCPVILNVTAMALTAQEFIIPSLVEQICGRVRWTESMTTLDQMGVTRYVECGSGKVLAGLIKRIRPEAATLSIQTAKDVSEFLATQ
jgi:[acyl-carrier-protein] S-malonyltransferase